MNQKQKKQRDKKIKKKIEQLRKELPEPQKCSRCPKPLFEIHESTDTEPYQIAGKPVCKECYFEALGDEVEKHPIGGGLRIHPMFQPVDVLRDA